ncbi:unnamed protein product [Cuscuta campestris]|uniref:BHLH domain-containing protein n=1 Tax=Cuscuta campestris TaxID=132261 RepID=A0A484NU48_9ASTE|nr:unnamed protein product [Cuscuta campestris]
MHANSLSCSNFPWQHHSRKNNLSSETSAREDDVSVSNRTVLAAIESSRLQLGDEAAGALPGGKFIGENSSDHQSHLWSHLLLSGGSTSGGLDYKSQPQEIGESSMLINLSSSPSSNTTTAAAATTTTAATNFIFDIMSSSDDDYLNRMGTTTTLDHHHHHHQDYYNAFINNNPHQYGGGGGGQTEMFDHHRLPPLSFTDEHLQGVSYNHNGIMGSACFLGGSGLNEYNCSGATDLIKAMPPDFPAGCFGNGNNKKRGAAAGLRTSPSRAPSTCSTISRSNSGRCQGSLATTKDAKKKKLEEHVEKMILKRPKDDTSSSKEEKMIQQVPKVKLADKITALQQIVSPFGKTDTASVLWEALGHIRFLQEQIQLLTNAHAKSNAIRKDVPWGGFIVGGGRKDAGGGGGEDDDVDLRSRGLCLVPTSFTPLIIREKNSNASDYLIPTYRGCLYDQNRIPRHFNSFPNSPTQVMAEAELHLHAPPPPNPTSASLALNPPPPPVQVKSESLPHPPPSSGGFGPLLWLQNRRPRVRVTSEYDSDSSVFLHKISCKLLDSLAKVKLSFQNDGKGEISEPQLDLTSKYLSLHYDIEDQNAIVKANFDLTPSLQLKAIHDVKSKQGEVAMVADLSGPAYKLELSSSVPALGTAPKVTFKFPHGEVSLQDKEVEEEEAKKAFSINGILKGHILNGVCTAQYKDESLDLGYLYKDEQMTLNPQISLPSNAVSFAFKRRFGPSDKLSYWYNFDTNYWSTVYKHTVSKDYKLKAGYDSEVRLGWASLWAHATESHTLGKWMKPT